MFNTGTHRQIWSPTLRPREFSPELVHRSSRAKLKQAFAAGRQQTCDISESCSLIFNPVKAVERVHPVEPAVRLQELGHVLGDVKNLVANVRVSEILPSVADHAGRNIGAHNLPAGFASGQQHVTREVSNRAADVQELLGLVGGSSKRGVEEIEHQEVIPLLESVGRHVKFWLKRGRGRAVPKLF